MTMSVEQVLKAGALGLVAGAIAGYVDDEFNQYTRETNDSNVTIFIPHENELYLFRVNVDDYAQQCIECGEKEEGDCLIDEHLPEPEIRPWNGKVTEFLPLREEEQGDIMYGRILNILTPIGNATQAVRYHIHKIKAYKDKQAKMN